MKRRLAVWLMLLAASAPAHRLDEYLQGTLITVAKDRVEAQMTLTPGVSVFPKLIAEMDTDGDGAISAAEQRAYVARVLRDLTLKIDGRLLSPEVASVKFPALEEMKEGRGEIQIELRAGLPGGGASRKLTLENRHESAVAAYQVNCLVPRDPAIRIVAQKRNYSQSSYELDYEEAGGWPKVPLGAGALLVGGWLALLWTSRSKSGERP